VTSYRKSQKSWGARREHFPSVLFEYQRRNRAKNPGDNIGFLHTTHKGQKVYLLDTEGYPIKDFKVLPMALSTKLEGFRIEAYKRLDDRIKLSDIQARMMPVWNAKKRELAVPGTNVLNMRMLRVRRRHRCLAWGTGGDTAFQQVMDREMTKKMVKENTTKALRPLSKKEVTYLEQVSYGTRLKRAGEDRKLSDDVRFAKWMLVSSLAKMGIEVTQEQFEFATRTIRGVTFQVARTRTPVGAKALKVRRVQDRVDRLPLVDADGEEWEDDEEEEDNDEDVDSDGEIEDDDIIGEVEGEARFDQVEPQHQLFEPKPQFEHDDAAENDLVISSSHNSQHQSSTEPSPFGLLAKIVASNAKHVSATITTENPQIGSNQGQSVQDLTDQDTFDQDIQADDEYREEAFEGPLAREPWRQNFNPNDTFLRRNGQVVFEYPDPLLCGTPIYYPDPSLPRRRIWDNIAAQSTSLGIYQDQGPSQAARSTAPSSNTGTQGGHQSKKRRLALEDSTQDSVNEGVGSKEVCSQPESNSVLELCTDNY
jgi:hypothetical protein